MDSLGRSGHALGTLLDTLDILGCSGVLWHVLGMFWECFWMLWTCSGNTLGRSVHVSKTFWKVLEMILKFHFGSTVQYDTVGSLICWNFFRNCAWNGQDRLFHAGTPFWLNCFRARVLLSFPFIFLAFPAISFYLLSSCLLVSFSFHLSFLL